MSGTIATFSLDLLAIPCFLPAVGGANVSLSLTVNNLPVFAAYGTEFTASELRYIARHAEALRLARNVAAGRQYLSFNNSTGFSADEAFVSSEQQSIRKAVAPMLFTMFGMVAVAALILSGSFKMASGVGVLTILALLVALLEFAKLRNCHRARNAIEQCAAAQPNCSMQPSEAKSCNTV